ncbi:methyltransferase type 11 [Pararhodospirillum oryzae]|uniref:Methyltransferase type 11 n=2 Tax=Pararhodospirillum oryzae TaxID=478448 RepID=A0A512H5P4_9PROT|nr:methyltransferase type 11 [Pararhodospirillum oryzae]
MTHADLPQLEAYYDRWSATYEDDLLSKGYDAPVRAAEILDQHGVDRARPVLDAGCGTGLTGLHLKKRGFSAVIGADYSTASLDKAREKGCYADLKRLDMNQTLGFPDNHFAAAQCIGALTYVKNMAGLMREFQRVVCPGGIVSFTHRLDLYTESFKTLLKKIEDEGLWTSIHRSEPQPYIPGHQDFGDDKAIIYDVFRVNAPA